MSMKKTKKKKKDIYDRKCQLQMTIKKKVARASTV